MFASKLKNAGVFAVFLLPALVLYGVFALFPLYKGIELSTTNWDGFAPWVPAQMKIEKFESEILAKVANKADRDFLLKFYEKDEAQGTYRKLELYGQNRDRVLAIMSATGYVNPDFHGVGLQNYTDIFTGNVAPGFYPQTYSANRFKPGDPLAKAGSIKVSEFENNLLKRISDTPTLDYLNRIYKKQGDFYLLDTSVFGGEEIDQQFMLMELPGLENDWEKTYKLAITHGLEQKTSAELLGSLKSLDVFTGGGISANDTIKAFEVLEHVRSAAFLKGILSQYWFVEETKMGVLMFTIFFVVVNVVAVNILALLLALGLDQKIKSANTLRSVFYIPNVLSMVVVAFIWQLIFNQLLPAVTGIRQWMNNPELAPWITVFVAVWQGLGYYTMVYIAGLQGVPEELLESASIDGATGPNRFFRIILPLLVPAITISLFLSLSGSLKTFDIIFALYPSTSTSLGIDNIIVNIFYEAFRDHRAAQAIAKAVLLMFVIVIITGIQLVISKKKEVEM